MNVTFSVNVFVELSSASSVAMTVIVELPYLCRPGVMARKRVEPAPLGARPELGTRSVLDDLAVIVTPNSGESVSLTENTRLVASSSGIVTEDGSVITGAAA